MRTTTTERGHLKRWRVAAPDPAADDLARTLRVGPLVGRLLHQRGVRDPEAGRRFLHPALGDLHDPARLPGAERAAERLARAVRDHEPIAIYGDYDVDGITATAILYHTLRAADPLADIRPYVPHRIEEGYGLNAEALEKLIGEGAKVIVSVDCGITATEPAALIKRLGADLIITDHHAFSAALDGNGDAAPRLPDAHTLVHPRLSGGRTYPFPELCGAGVAYKIAWQFARCWCGSERVSQAFRELLVDLLSFAALGTIADVVPLVDENRTIAVFGLRRIKHTRFTGLNALIDAARLRDEKIDSYHVGFVLGPRLNACGRMGHAKEAIRLLTDVDPAAAQRIAEQLTRENDRRRATQRAILEQATAMVRDRGYDGDDCRAIVLGHDEWHPGVVGIVCSRLVETFGKPAVLLQTDNGHAQGSARSIDAFDIHAAFSACAAHLDSFGGHAMAAGLRMRSENIAAFRDAMAAYAADRLSPDDLAPLLDIDAEADLPAIDRATVEQASRLAPFGRCNRAPVLLVRGATVAQPPATMGREARHLSLLVRQGGAMVRCVGWNLGDLQPRIPPGGTIDLAAEPKLNHYNGRTTVELVIRDIRW